MTAKGKKQYRDEWSGEWGRPTDLTPEVQKKICDFLRLGNYRETAARAAGVHERTVRTWLKWGLEKKKPIYEQFLEACEKAEAEAEAMGLGVIARAAQAGDWKAMAWRLERKHPERWGLKRSMELSGKAGGAPIAITLSDIDKALENAAANAALAGEEVEEFDMDVAENAAGDE